MSHWHVKDFYRFIFVFCVFFRTVFWIGKWRIFNFPILNCSSSHRFGFFNYSDMYTYLRQKYITYAIGLISSLGPPLPPYFLSFMNLIQKVKMNLWYLYRVIPSLTCMHSWKDIIFKIRLCYCSSSDDAPHFPDSLIFFNSAKNSYIIRALIEHRVAVE